MKNQDKLCFKEVLSRDEDWKEKEKQAKEKETKLPYWAQEITGLHSQRELNYSKGLANQARSDFCQESCDISEPFVINVSKAAPDSQVSYGHTIDYEIIEDEGLCQHSHNIFEHSYTQITKAAPDSQVSYGHMIDYEIMGSNASSGQISARKSTIPVFDYLTDDKCRELSKLAGRNFSPMAVRGLR